ARCSLPPDRSRKPAAGWWRTRPPACAPCSPSCSSSSFLFRLLGDCSPGVGHLPTVQLVLALTWPAMADQVERCRSRSWLRLDSGTLAVALTPTFPLCAFGTCPGPAETEAGRVLAERAGVNPPAGLSRRSRAWRGPSLPRSGAPPCPCHGRLRRPSGAVTPRPI